VGRLVNYETLRITVEGATAHVELARPETDNRIDARFVRELVDVCATLAEQPAVRVVVLSAVGGTFCAGWAEGVLGDGGLADPEEGDPFGCLAHLGQPVIAAVSGEVASGGLELALACDIRIAAADARFALPETELGILPRAGGSQRLPRVVGRGRALAMLLTGEVLDAEAALRDGLVSKVVAPEHLAAEAGELAATIARRGPIALRYAKEAVSRGLDLTLDQALRYETDLTVILQTTDDRAEGVKAFIERREPEFKGR
jgi:enoyl-CoA hydratase/carnithine racemase